MFTATIVTVNAGTRTVALVVDDADIDPTWHDPPTAQEPNLLGGARITQVIATNNEPAPWHATYNGVSAVIPPNTTRTYTIPAQMRVNYGSLTLATDG